MSFNPSIASRFGFQAIFPVLLRALLLFGVSCTLPSNVNAQDYGEATLKVNRENDSVNDTQEHSVNGKLILTTKAGVTKERKFVPSKPGTVTVINIKSYNIFGGVNYDQDQQYYFGPGAVIEYIDAADHKDSRTVVHNYGLDMSNLKLALDDGTQEREIASEIVTTPAGAKRTVRRTRTIEHSSTLTNTNELEIGAKAQFPILSGEIRIKLQESRSETSRQSETVEQSVEIDGSLLPKAKLIWVEKTISGKATAKFNGQEVTFPFRYRDSLELRVSKVD